MGRPSHVQESFAAGELSHRFFGRGKSDVYRAGLAEATNWEVLAQGPLLRRGGTRHVCPLSGAAQARLIEFRAADGREFVLELGDEVIRVYTSAGPLTPAAGNLVTNGGFVSGAGWTPSLSPGGDPLAEFPGGFVALSAERTFDPETQHYTTTLGSVSQAVAVAQGTSHRLTFRLISHSGASSGVKVTVGAWSTTVYASGLYTFSIPDQGAEIPQIIEIKLVGTYNASASVGEVDLQETGVDLFVVSPWTLAQVAAVQFVCETGQDRVLFAHPNVAPQVLRLDAVVGDWVLEAMPFVSRPAEWAGTNQPSAIAIFQGRLLLAGTPAQRSTIWASRSGSVFDFTTETSVSGTPTVLDSDAIVAPVATSGVIRWMRGREALLVGTDLGELSITASGRVITPSDLQVREESAFGSAAIQAIDVGDQVLFVSRDRRKLRAIDYSLERQAWVAHDLTFAAEHMTEGLVREIHYARDPHNTIALVLDSGEVACCTYDRAAGVAGYWRAVVSGVVVSAATLQAVSGTELYLAVRRDGAVYLERLPMSETDRVHMDAAVSGVPPEGGGEVAGLAHLEGLEVQILIDGALEPPATVAGGAVTLLRGGAEYVIGLGFTARARLLRPEPAGYSPSAKLRWVRLWLRLFDSALPQVNGETLADRTPATPMDSAEPLRSIDSGPYTTGSVDGDPTEVVIEQSLPFRTEILSIFGSVAANEV